MTGLRECQAGHEPFTIPDGERSRNAAISDRHYPTSKVKDELRCSVPILPEPQLSFDMRMGLKARKRASAKEKSTAIRKAMADKSIVLIGLMGAGKTAIGRRLAGRLSLPFVDADSEIERAAGQSISDIFGEHGEAYFRDGERRVIERLLQDGPQVLATGGGAYITPETREAVGQKGISVWLKADLDVLMERVGRRDNRPLLKTGDPEQVMKKLIEDRYPVYANADITVQSRNVTHETIVGEIVKALHANLIEQSGRGKD